MNDFKTKTALLILNDYFGDTIHEVGKIILQHEKSTLTQIIRLLNSSINSSNNNNYSNTTTSSAPSNKISYNANIVKQSLIVLNHHNCLIVELPYISEYINETTINTTHDNSQSQQHSYLYSLDVDNVLNRLRFVKLVSYAEENFGAIATVILEEVMLHGRIQSENIFKKCSQKMSGSSSSSSDSNTDVQMIKKVFEQLVENRFLVNVPLFAAKRLIRAEKDVSRVGRKPAAHSTSNINNSNSSRNANAQNYTNTTDILQEQQYTSTSSTNYNKRPIGDISQQQQQQQQQHIIEGSNTTVIANKKGRGTGGNTMNKKIKTEKTSKATTNVATSGAVVGNEMMSMELRAILNHTSTSTSLNAAYSTVNGKIAGTSSSSSSSTGRNNMLLKSDEEELEWMVDSSHMTSYAIGESSSSEIPTTIMSKLVLWTIGFDQYARRARHVHCERVVQQQHGEICGHVIRIMLRNSMNSELGSKRSKSGEVSLSIIHTQLSQYLHDHQLPPIAMNDLKQVMEYMRLSESAALIKVIGTEFEENGPSYMVNIEGLINIMQRKTINNIAVQRFGFVSARIVEVLLKHRYLEQQSVCDMAILPARETRERLYKLFLDKWINYIELSKRNDFNPSTSSYFWYLDLVALRGVMLDHMFQTMYNLMLRRQHEMLKGKEYLDGKQALDNPVDRHKSEKVAYRLGLLDEHILRIDDTIMLMEIAL